MSERFARVELARIEPDPQQPRIELESVAGPGLTEAHTLEGLAQSIRSFGILQPIRIRRIVPTLESLPADGSEGLQGERYRIISGERRFQAAKLAGLETVPALIEDDTETPEERLLKQVTENLQRKALTATELALAIDALLQRGSSREEVHRKLGISSSTVTILLALLKLSEPIRVAFARGQIESPRAAYDLNRLPAEVQERLIAQAHAEGRAVSQREVRTVRLEAAKAEGQALGRFKAPALDASEEAQLRQVMAADDALDAYTPEADRDAVFGEAWRTMDDHQRIAGIPGTSLPAPTNPVTPVGPTGHAGEDHASGDASAAEELIDLPAVRLTRAQALRLLHWLQSEKSLGLEESAPGQTQPLVSSEGPHAAGALRAAAVGEQLVALLRAL